MPAPRPAARQVMTVACRPDSAPPDQCWRMRHILACDTAPDQAPLYLLNGQIHDHRPSQGCPVCSRAPQHGCAPSKVGTAALQQHVAQAASSGSVALHVRRMIETFCKAISEPLWCMKQERLSVLRGRAEWRHPVQADIVMVCGVRVRVRRVAVTTSSRYGSFERGTVTGWHGRPRAPSRLGQMTVGLGLLPCSNVSLPPCNLARSQ